MARESTRGIAAVFVVLVVGGLIAGCNRPKPAATAPPAAVAPSPAGTAAAAKTDVASQPPGKTIAALCLKHSDDVAKAVGQIVISVKDLSAPDAPLRCLYRTAALPALIEVGKSGDLAAERKDFEKKGGHPSDSPLGNGAFRTESGGFYQVIGQKGGTRLAVGGTARFPPLEALWLKVAQGLGL